MCRQHGLFGKDEVSGILAMAHSMMVLTVMFFCFSCVLALSPADLAAAKAQNISILSYLANHFQTPVIAYAAPLIALVAITKSFLGHYIGASEGFQGLIVFPSQHRLSCVWIRSAPAFRPSPDREGCRD